MVSRNVFMIPVSQKNQASMKRRLIAFSSILYLLIFIIGSAFFIVLMGQIVRSNIGDELKKTVELECLKLEASINAEIAIALKMADSQLIRRYFLNPEDATLKTWVAEEIESYRRALTKTYIFWMNEEKDKSALTRPLIFWINDKERIFYTTDHEPYLLDPENPVNYWYNKTLYETTDYNFNINYNPDLNVSNIWVNAPVFNDDGTPIGMVGIGMNLTAFLNDLYMNYSGSAELYFFNHAGEITGARERNLVNEKANVYDKLEKNVVNMKSKVESFHDGKVIYFNTKDNKGVVALGSIPNLNWYITAVHHFSFGEVIQTGVTVLFAVMMVVILTVFAVFNIFIAKLLEPLHHIVSEISQLSSDWDLDLQGESKSKDEIETLGEFLNMTIVDQLTGIYNRRFFDGNMKKIIKSLSRTKGKLSLLMLDIDFFKKYNDTYGHDKGDACLKDVAAALYRNITREEDFVARYGGEEFVVVLPNTDENGAGIIAEKLINKVRECSIPHVKSDVVPYVTVSVGGTTGIVEFSHKESDYVKCADAALYRSKQTGRNRYSFQNFELDFKP